MKHIDFDFGIAQKAQSTAEDSSFAAALAEHGLTLADLKPLGNSSTNDLPFLLVNKIHGTQVVPQHPWKSMIALFVLISLFFVGFYALIHHFNAAALDAKTKGLIGGLAVFTSIGTPLSFYIRYRTLLKISPVLAWCSKSSSIKALNGKIQVPQASCLLFAFPTTNQEMTSSELHLLVRDAEDVYTHHLLLTNSSSCPQNAFGHFLNPFCQASSIPCILVSNKGLFSEDWRVSQLPI